MTKAMFSRLALLARVAGYAHRVMSDDSEDDNKAFEKWLFEQQRDDTSIITLSTMWGIGLNDYDPRATNPDGLFWMTPATAAKLKGVNVATIYAVLNNDKRRERIFPRTARDEQGWLLHTEDVASYRPVRGRGRKAKGNEPTE